MLVRRCSTKEMCEYLGVSRDTLLTWINEKNMSASKVGGLRQAKLMNGSKAVKRLINQRDELQIRGMIYDRT